MRRRPELGFLGTASVLAVLLLLPAVASAQTSLAGTVRDTSGAVLPGVTVDARSPALIEQVRSAITDGAGQYSIVQLPPGVYSVTFTLPGFATVVREGVQVSGVNVITINAELRVGGLEETITVTGETPIVDVQSSRRGAVLTDDVVKTLPATRGYNAIVFLVPGVTGGSNQVDLMPAMRIFYSHGGRGNEGRVQVDGLNVGAAFNGGGVSGYTMDTTNAEELAFTLSGGLGEAEVGGTILNIVPKTGGNTFSGSAFLSSAGEWSQGSNLDDELRSFGITNPNALIQNWDASVALGGPFVRDRLWFFGTYRDYGTHQDVPGGFANAAAYDRTRWDHQRDENTVIRGANSKTIAAMRLTAQVHPLHKVGIYYDHQWACDGSAMTQDASNCRPRGADWVANGNATNAPESASGVSGLGNTGAAGYQDSYAKVVQATYTSPLTNQLLLEAGFSSYFSRWGWMAPPGTAIDYIRANDQSTGYNYRGIDWNFDGINWNRNWRASASYVTGSHNFKFGWQGGLDVMDQWNNYNNTRLGYRFNNNTDLTPNRLSMSLGRWNTKTRTRHTALYAQDQWTRDKLSLQGAIRYERAWSWFPEGQGWTEGPQRFMAEPITFPRTTGVPGFDDIMLRGGLAYDVFGDGRTSLKVNVGKYMQAANNQDRYTVGNPAQSYSRSTNRSWSDDNGDYVPDCDLMNPNANGECGGWQTRGFGLAQSVNDVNPDILEGWGVRPSDMQLGVGIQHEIVPRVSVEVSYNRRWFSGFTATDNRALGPEDYDTFTINVPQDSRLPNGGGYPVSGIALKTESFGRIADNYVTFSSDYGDQSIMWHGVDVNVQARLQNGLIFQGGTSTGRGVRNDCEVLDALPEARNTGGFVPVNSRLDACDVKEDWLTQFRGLASYVVPKIDVQLSANFQFKPGTLGIGGNTAGTNGDSLQANWAIPAATMQQVLGRPLAGRAFTHTMNILLPGELYGDSVNQVDLRVAKIFEFGGTRTQVGIDLYNLFNANPALGYNETFGPAWLTPTSVLLPRFVRFQITVDY